MEACCNPRSEITVLTRESHGAHAGADRQTIFEVARRGAKDAAQIMQRTRAEHADHLRRPTADAAAGRNGLDGSGTDEDHDSDASERRVRPTKRAAEADEATVQVRPTPNGPGRDCSGLTRNNTVSGFHPSCGQASFARIIGGKRVAAPGAAKAAGAAATAAEAAATSAFRDPEYYIEHRPRDHEAERGYAIKGNSFVEQARDAVMDVLGDDADGLRRNQRQTQWDRKKKKFVSVAVGADNKKRIRTESGALIPASYKTNKYAEWAEKNRAWLDRAEDLPAPRMVKTKDGRWRQILPIPSADRRRGADDGDDDGDDGEGGGDAGRGGRKHGGRGGRGGKAGKGGTARGKPPTGKAANRPVKSELKNVDQIRKERKIKARRAEHLKRKQERKKQRGGSAGGKKRR